MKILADTITIILYIWKPITDMLADKSISEFLYTFWEPDLKEKVSSLKSTSQTLLHKQPSLNSVRLKQIFYPPITRFRHKKSHK